MFGRRVLTNAKLVEPTQLSVTWPWWRDHYTRSHYELR